MNTQRFHGAHAQRLERWLGAEGIRSIHEAAREFYAPIPIANIPGNVQVFHDDFFGDIHGGGFASLADFVSEAKVKTQIIPFSKIETFNAGLRPATTWDAGDLPVAGGTPDAIPGGAVPTNLTAGALPLTNPAAGDTLHLGEVQVTINSNNYSPLLLYDRIFHAGSVLHTTTGNQAVSGVPTRYQTSAGAVGNFAFLEMTTVPSVSPDQAVTMTYQDQDGNLAEAAPAFTLRAQANVKQLPFSVPNFFIPLNSADNGLRNVTQISFDVSLAAGASNVVIGHPIAFVATPTSVSTLTVLNGVYSMFNLIPISSGACLAWLVLFNGGDGAKIFGQIALVSG